MFTDLGCYSLAGENGMALPVVAALCYDDPKGVAVIKAATQAKRRAGVDAGAMVFDVTSTDPIPSGNKYQPFIRVPGNRDRIASHLWQRIASHLEGKGRHDLATLMAFGVAPVETTQSTMQGRRGEVEAGDTPLPVAISTGGGDDARASAVLTGDKSTTLPVTGGMLPGSASGGVVSDTDAEGHGAAPPLSVHVWKMSDDNPTPVAGPGIGEGELSTTHAVIWHHEYTGEAPVKSWMVTSVDTDQLIHLLLAMAEGKIETRGDDKVRVTVRRRRGEGAVQFVDVNRMFDAICTTKQWEAGSEEKGCPKWLEEDGGRAKVALYVVMYFLGVCDFLPAFFFLKLPKLFEHVLTTIAQPGLFNKPIVEKDANGKWLLNVNECVKMLGVCYFQMHWNVFQITYTNGAQQLWEAVDGEAQTFVEKVRRIIFSTKGPNGKKNCPDWDALEFQVKRAARVLVYWQSALEWRAEPVDFEGHGWIADSGKPEDKLNPTNCCVQLSRHALLNREGRVKLQACGCTGGVKKKPTCDGNCTCARLKKDCIPGYCKCHGNCVKNREEVKSARAAEATRQAGVSREDIDESGDVEQNAQPTRSTLRFSTSGKDFFFQGAGTYSRKDVPMKYIHILFI